MSPMDLLLVIYGIGVAFGLVFTDARPVGRVALALMWPIGPLAFVVTMLPLVAASLVAFPLFAAAVSGAAAVACWMFR